MTRPLRESEDLYFLTGLMRDFPAPWCVAGGWALDLFLGRVTREHADIELAVFRDDQARLHEHLNDWRFEKIVAGRRLCWAPRDWLELPVHEIHAHSPAGAQPPATIEFLFNERTSDDWVFRRHPRITLPLSRSILHSRNPALPILCPEIVLLYKSKSPRAKDEADFRHVLPELDALQQRWFRAALELHDQKHPWLGELA